MCASSVFLLMLALRSPHLGINTVLSYLTISYKQARKELERLRKSKIHYQNKKRRALERQQTEKLQIQQRQERERRREDEREAAFTRDIETLVGSEWAGPWGTSQSCGYALDRKRVSVSKTCMCLQPQVLTRKTLL